MYREHPIMFLSLLSIFSSLYAVISIYPVGFPIIGLESSRPIQLTQFIAIMYGYLFGPILGSLAIGIGGFLSSSIAIAPPFYQLNFLPAFVSAFVSGLSVRHEQYAIAIFIVLWVTYFIYPVVGALWVFPFNTWFHFVTFVIYLTSIVYLNKYRGLTHRENIGEIFTTSLFSTVAGQLSGTALFEAIYYPAIISTVEGFKIIWVSTMFIYPVERTIIAILATLTIVPVYRVIKTLYPQIIYR